MSTSRRGFLKGLACMGACAAAVTGASGCAPNIDPAPLLDVDAPVDGKITLRVASYPDLLRDGGALTLRIPGQPNVLVVHPSGNSFAAMDASCTHVGCPLGFEQGDVVCPCHGARFDTRGQVLAPPARVPLKTYVANYHPATDTLTIDFHAGEVGFPAVVDGKLFLPFSQFPALSTAGGVVSGTPQGHGKLLFVFALEGGAYSAVDSICTHKGCVVGFDEGLGELECPCHAARFDKQGAVTKPPFNDPLDVPLETFTATASADGVTVQVA
jgi:Rieske Fe-S protein